MAVVSHWRQPSDRSCVPTTKCETLVENLTSWPLSVSTTHIGLGAWELAAADARISVELEPGYTKGEPSFAHIAMHESCEVWRALLSATLDDRVPSAASLRHTVVGEPADFVDDLCSSARNNPLKK